ncbi:hypothetical protein ABRY18_03850 [Clostridioides difficile]
MIIHNKLFHYTCKNNLQSILNQGQLNPDVFGDIYFTPTLSDCEKFVLGYSELNNIDKSQYAILEIDISYSDIDISNLEVSFDHNKKSFYNADALVYNGVLKIDNIKIHTI